METFSPQQISTVGLIRPVDQPHTTYLAPRVSQV